MFITIYDIMHAYLFDHYKLEAYIYEMRNYKWIKIVRKNIHEKVDDKNVHIET